jgi:hypothetical protein
MTHSSIGQITNTAISRQRALRQAEAQLSLQQKWRIARAKAIANLHGVDPRWNSFVLGELRSLCAHHHYSHVQFERNRGYPKRQIGVDGYPIDSQADDDPPDQAA